MNAEIESQVRAYARLSHDVIGRINFACDLNNDDALRVIESEQVQLNQAFFVLSFAALENQVTSLACARLNAEDRRTAMRASDFEKRWDTALTVATEILATAIPWQSARPVVLSWYKIRSDIVHGRPPTLLADVPPVLYLADEIAVTVDRLTGILNRS